MWGRKKTEKNEGGGAQSTSSTHHCPAGFPLEKLVGSAMDSRAEVRLKTFKRSTTSTHAMYLREEQWHQVRYRMPPPNISDSWDVRGLECTAGSSEFTEQYE